MIFVANQDVYGNLEHFTSDQIRHILDLIDGYMGIPYEIHEIRMDNINDKCGRIDIEIRFQNQKHQWVQQKLLILNDELIDGKTFHERFHEWYS